MTIYKFKIYYGSGDNKYNKYINNTIKFLKDRWNVSDDNHQIIFLNELLKLENSEIIKKLQSQLELKKNITYSNLLKQITNNKKSDDKLIDNFIIIKKLKNYFNNKIKQLDNQDKFTNKIINTNNEIEIEKYIFIKKFNDRDVKYYTYFTKDYMDKNIYLNFNLIKFIYDILNEEIDHVYTSDNDKVKNIDKINENNYFIIYKLITKIINIKNLKKFNFISVFFTDDDINKIVRMIFEKINQENISNYDQYKYIKNIFKIYIDFHFKIDENNFNLLIELTKNTKIDYIKSNDNIDYEESEDELGDNKETIINNKKIKLDYYKKLLYIYYYNKNKLDKKNIIFIKDYILEIFNEKNNNNNFISIIKNSKDKPNTHYKFDLYLLFSVVYTLDLLNDEEISFIKKNIVIDINIISSDYNEYHISSNDEKILNGFLNEITNITFKKEYYDNYNIIPYDFYIKEKNLLIELDGIYHFTLTLTENGSLINKYNIRDLVKSELAEKLGYKFIRFTSIFNAEEIDNLYYINIYGDISKESFKNINIYLQENIFDEKDDMINTDLDFSSINKKIILPNLKNEKNKKNFKTNLEKILNSV